LDGSGRVTSSSVVRSTGAAILDQELAAMARRASPFPPPPGGRAVSFTVPIGFRLN
jgi:TonB family protein